MVVRALGERVRGKRVGELQKARDKERVERKGMLLCWAEKRVRDIIKQVGGKKRGGKKQRWERKHMRRENM